MGTLTARLEPWLEEEIRSFWAEHGEGPSAGLRHVAEEWWVTREFPRLEFRDGVAGRRAGLRGGPDVWEVVLVARDYDSFDGVVEHFGGYIDAGALREALAYAERFAEVVDAIIADNERVGRLLRDSAATR